MLEVLFGNKNVERILLFLFVNNRCYPTQLSRIFAVSLTPLQKVFARLEKGGLLCSHYEGKTRIYRFNKGFCLLEDLESLLKKAYTALSSCEKQRYCIGYEGPSSFFESGGKTATLLEFWSKLSAVRRLSFSAQSKSTSNSGWDGQGACDVRVSKAGLGRLTFHERGVWKGNNKQNMNFTNTFRWTLDRINGVVSLEHLRYGIDNPVFLFHLTPCALHALSSVNSHLCGEDAYFGRACFDRYSLKLNWRVIGPKKDEEIEYCYV